MAKKTAKPASLPSIPQQYPRIEDTQSKYYGCVDDAKLIPHPKPRKITPETLKSLIFAAIEDANSIMSRGPLSLPPNLTPEEQAVFHIQEGRQLFEYFHDYPSDPAATAHEYHLKNYRDVGIELFRNRILQKGRMNSGWRYQFLAVNCAKKSERFDDVAGFGTSQGDFTAKIHFQDKTYKPLHLYVSVKNRSDTLGGQDWPNSIASLETYAKNDQNKTGPYLCVFGVAMDRGMRRIPRKKGTKQAHSENTEIWLSDYFWPFFSAYSYEEIMTAMLEVLVSAVESAEALPTQVDVPDEVLTHFGEECKAAELIDELGNFTDPFKLVRFFCAQTPSKIKSGRKTKKDRS